MKQSSQTRQLRHKPNKQGCLAECFSPGNRNGCTSPEHLFMCLYVLASEESEHASNDQVRVSRNVCLCVLCVLCSHGDQQADEQLFASLGGALVPSESVPVGRINQEHVIPISELTLKELIGSGAEGKVCGMQLLFRWVHCTALLFDLQSSRHACLGDQGGANLLARPGRSWKVQLASPLKCFVGLGTSSVPCVVQMHRVSSQQYTPYCCRVCC